MKIPCAATNTQHNEKINYFFKKSTDHQRKKYASKLDLIKKNFFKWRMSRIIKIYKK